jgi:hypothetical protein
MSTKKKKYRALSSGIIARVGTQVLAVKKGKVYEWGDDEAEIYLKNAPENFEIIGEKKPEVDPSADESITPEQYLAEKAAQAGKPTSKKKGGK